VSIIDDIKLPKGADRPSVTTSSSQVVLSSNKYKTHVILEKLLLREVTASFM